MVDEGADLRLAVEVLPLVQDLQVVERRQNDVHPILCVGLARLAVGAFEMTLLLQRGVGRQLQRGATDEAFHLHELRCSIGVRAGEFFGRDEDGR